MSCNPSDDRVNEVGSGAGASYSVSRPVSVSGANDPAQERA